MKLTTGILAVAMMAGTAWAQSPSAAGNNNPSKAAVPAQPSKPTAGAPAPAVKPAAIPGAKPITASKPAVAAAAKPAAAPAAKPVVSASAANQNNRLEAVKVVRDADDIQIEISSREAVTPKVSKLSSPARVLVELPATVMANQQSKIAVGSAGVKGVRIGMDGKTPPTTSVVVDLEQACAYELKPGPGNGFVLTLHTQTVAKNIAAPAPAKAAAPAAKVQTAAAKPVVATPVPTKGSPAVQAATGKPVVAITIPTKGPAPVAKVQAAAKPVVAMPPAAAPKVDKIVAVATPTAAKGATTKITASKPAAPADNKIVATKTASPTSGKNASQEKPAAASAMAEGPKPPKVEEKKWSLTGKRDPFFSPVVQQTGGSGCSTGKKCLEIGQINVRGVVKADSGFIAVVTNSLNKAYFLHENDPVFNGYVVRITGDSVVFQEQMQDKLGKPFTREVVKKITTPAV